MPLDSSPKINERPTPFAAETEQVLLGAVILENHLFARLNALTVSDFFSPFHRQVFSAMLELVEENRPIDPILIGEILNTRRDEFFGNVYQVTQLTVGVPIGLNIREYVAKLKEKSARRDVLRRLGNLQIAVSDETMSVKEIAASLANLETSLRDALPEQTESFRFLGEVFQTDVLPTLAAYYKDEAGEFLISSGFPQIDSVLNGGFYRSDFVAVVAPPKSAKSAFALQLAMNIAMSGETVGLLSLEMSNLQNGFRFIAQKSYRDSIAAHGSPIEAIDSSFLRPGIYQETYKKAFETAMSLFDTKLLLCQQPLEWQELKAETRRLVKEKNLTVLVVDYWQLVFNSRRGVNRADLLAEIAKGLKQLGQELNIVVIALGQFNQEGLKHKASGGELNAALYLEGSGELVKSANIVITLDIDEASLTNPGAPRKGKMTFKPLRSAPDARLECMFFGKFLTLEID